MTSKEKAGEILQKQGNNNNKYTKDPGPQIYVSNNNKNFGLNPAQSLFNIYQCLTSCKESEKSLERLSGRSDY